MSREFQVLLPEEYLIKHIENGNRADGRKLEERRPFSISAEIIKTADGSAIVKQVKIFPFPWHYLRYKEGLRWYVNPSGTFGANSSKKNVG